MQVSRVVFGALAACGLAACVASPDPDSLTFDPLEPQNRRAHALNKRVDRAAFGPVARAWGTTIPREFRQGVTNLNYNWRHPHYVVQYTLQGRGGEAAVSATRFGVNTLLGLGGLLDVADGMGLEFRETGVDETMHVWGVPEYAYLEVPLGGPGTQRDWNGWVLDILLDPAFYVLPASAAYTLVGIAGADIVNDRYELDPVIDELLYQSADSYTAQRISYLQNMRARLQGGPDIEQLEDVYADF
jgi:phospholipid-binding lipoprotein MlaA